MSDNLPAPTDPGRWPILADKSSEITVASTQRRKLAVRVLPILGVALFVAGLVAPSLSSSLWPVMLCWMGGLGAFAALTAFIPSAPGEKTGRGELVFPSTPVRLGEPITVRYRQHRATTGPAPRLTASVRCEEWILHRLGDYNKHTRSAEVWQEELALLPSDPLPSERDLREAWQLRIPPHLPPSFDATHYKIRWFVTVRTEASGRGARQEFGFPVAPEVFRDLR